MGVLGLRYAEGGEGQYPYSNRYSSVRTAKSVGKRAFLTSLGVVTDNPPHPPQEVSLIIPEKKRLADPMQLRLRMDQGCWLPVSWKPGSSPLLSLERGGAFGLKHLAIA